MDTFRTMLYAALALVLFMMWQAWEKDYGQATTVPTAAQTNSTQTSDAAARDVPQAPASSGGRMTSAPDVAVSSSKRIKVHTDVYDIELDTRGGDIKKAYLLNYPTTARQPDQPFPLMNDGSPNLFISQSGLLGDGAPNHAARYSSPVDQYRLQEGQDKLEVTLQWRNERGLVVDKVYTFYRGRYDFDLEYRVANHSATAWQGSMYRQFKRTEDTGIEQSRFLYTYTGGVISTQEKPYEKITFDDMKDETLKKDIEQGWVAMIQHYFVGAWIGDKNDTHHAYTKVSDGNKYVIGMITPTAAIAPGSNGTIKTRAYIGPKLQDHLAEVAPHLELTVDYGWLTILAEPIFWVMKWIHSVVGNWGWTIILLTILIKLMFYKLSETSYKSMANLRRVHPRLQGLKERYGDDKQGMQKAMMKIYQEEKINPLGGCLPILVQIPVFIALYWVLLESVEMRQAPFILWLDDLSSKDPYYILPLLMGASMLIQQKLNPSPLDPVQAKIMMMLPVVFTVFFAFFPSGLVLYWVTNNVLSITQQWVITKRIAG
ncbi:membrane protein insertase YidC [Sulfuriflexus sp.]|uniref:membrane protein insertase YidC n=1 Tax=Sulfuriflexus sp. TaxID=2015443 RepID=UPI0028CBC366|nr:membrane protein insertase YidC [Sulfuriflexus sp.]MDT8404092.1 membrane protein insertase YidC [Sulfuriflexus sp.]